MTAREQIGRYALYPAFASGGMASVHFARLLGEVGFTRVVAIKRLHEQFSKNADFAAMLLDEARLSANIHSPNVVATLDVLAVDEQLLLVMEYVSGESLFSLLRTAAAGTRMPAAHAVAIVVGALHGLHAAHEAKSASGKSLGIVHRDVSPPNLLVGEDGVARIIDFGIAKAVERVHSTREGEDLLGKIRYMAPEQLERRPIDRRVDIYSASVVLWEALTGTSYIEADSPAGRVRAVLTRRPQAPSTIVRDLPRELDEVVVRGLSKNPKDRYESALAMATALEGALRPSTQREVGAWVSEVAADTLRARATRLAELERDIDAPDGDELVAAGGGSATVVVKGARAATQQPLWRRIALPAMLLLLPCALVLAFTRLSRPTEPPAATRDDVPTPIVSTAEVAKLAAPVLSASEAPSASAPAAAISASAAPIKSAPAHTARPAPRGTCNPPYTMDHGIKVPKLGCL